MSNMNMFGPGPVPPEYLGNTNQFYFPSSQSYSNMNLTNKIIVNSIEEVKRYPVPQNGDYLFIHNTQPILFRKTVDAYGQFNIQVFDIAEKEQPTSPQYVSLEEFNALKKEFEALKNKPEVVT